MAGSISRTQLTEARQELADSDLPSLTGKGNRVTINRTGTTDCNGFADGRVNQEISVRNINAVVYKDNVGSDDTQKLRIPGGDLTMPAGSNIEFRLEAGYGWIPKGLL